MQSAQGMKHSPSINSSSSSATLASEPSLTGGSSEHQAEPGETAQGQVAKLSSYSFSAGAEGGGRGAESPLFVRLYF